LLDANTRANIARRVAREVTPSKQTGAALFWNSSTKHLEIYIASEGAYYDLAGNLLTNVAPEKLIGATITKRFRVDSLTGDVVVDESLHAPRWQLKKGYAFDKTSGTFTWVGNTNAAPAMVTKEEALELK